MFGGLKVARNKHVQRAAIKESVARPLDKATPKVRKPSKRTTAQVVATTVFRDWPHPRRRDRQAPI
jgi:hypothetical protein